MISKKQSKKIIFLFAILIACVFVSKDVSAAGLTVGNAALSLTAGENLYYGVTSSSNAAGNFLLFEKGAGNVIFRIDNAGNITSNGSLVGSNSYWNVSGNSLFASSTSWNLGIGTTNPLAKLQVGSWGTIDGGVDGNVGTLFGSNVYYSSGYNAIFNGNAIFSAYGNNGIDLYAQSAAPGLFTPISRLHVSLDGNVGIGTTTPLDKLEINGNLRFSTANPYITASSYVIIPNGIYVSGGTPYFANQIRARGGISNDTATYLTVAGGTSGNTYFSGNIGIGSNAPAFKLDVSGTGSFSQPVIVGTPTATNHAATKSYVDSVASSAAGGGVGTGASGQTLRNNGTSWVANSILYNNGTNIGIGTTGPTQKLDVAGNIKAVQLNLYQQGTGIDGTSNPSTYTGGMITQHDVYSGSETNWPGSYGTLLTVMGRAGHEGLQIFQMPSQTADLRIRSTWWNNSVNGWGGWRIVAFTDSPSFSGNISFPGSGIWNSSGNVGVGSTAPAYKLDVAGTGNFTQPVIVGTPTAAGHATTKSYVDSVASSAAGGGVGTGTSGQTLRSNGTSWISNSTLYNNGTNVGIGTTNPLRKLVVSGPDDGNPQLRLMGTADTVRWWDIGRESAATGRFKINEYNSGTETERLTILMGGNVGVGTASPAASLDISSKVKITSGGTIYNTDSGRWLDMTGTLTDSLRVSGNIITTGGNVGVGTITPGANMEIYTTISSQPTLRLNSNFGSGNYIDFSPFISGVSNNGFNLLQNGVSRLVISGTGNVGIGIISPTASLDVFSKLKLTSGGTIYNTDSGRWLDMTGVLTDSLRVSGNIITTGGNVGIGTTNPGAKLEVQYVNAVTDPNTSVYPLKLVNNAWLGNQVTGIEFWNGSNKVVPTSRIISQMNGSGAGGENLYFQTQTSSVSNPNPNKPTTKLFIAADGGVGIGTTDPGLYSLYVNGSSYVNGSITLASGANISMPGTSQLTVNKLQVNTIDPLYNIKGTNYSTFAASIVGGVKEEISGKIKISKKVGNEYQSVINFDEEKVGSDLWVWRSVIDFNKDNVEAIITPYGAFAKVYYSISDNNFIFHSDVPVEVSYRLLAKRFDWKEWPTKAKDQKEKAGFIIK